MIFAKNHLSERSAVSSNTSVLASRREMFLAFARSHTCRINRSTLYTVRRRNGEVSSFWGSTLLDRDLRAAREGDLIRVIYLGAAKTQAGYTYKRYSVYIKR